VSNTLSGTVTMQITTVSGTLVASTTMNGSSIVKGNTWNTFYFPNLTLSSGTKYRINMIRSNAHNYVNDYFYWRTSSGGNDAYPKGVNNVYPSWTLDYAFITYSDGYLDQQQTSHNYGFAIGNTYYAWQEFVPQKIWIVAQ
jgi:hypothetical protein